MHIEKDIPIWASDWTFQNKQGAKFIVKDIPTKCHNTQFAITNKWQVRRALGYVNATPSIKKKLIPISIKLKKQIGLGKYEKHELYNPEEK